MLAPQRYIDLHITYSEDCVQEINILGRQRVEPRFPIRASRSQQLPV